MFQVMQKGEPHMSDIIGLQHHAYTESHQVPQSVKKNKGKTTPKNYYFTDAIFFSGQLRVLSFYRAF